MDIEISNGRLTAVINTKGAELTALRDNQGKEYIWEGNPEYWGKHSPILFPIVGTLKNNTYTYNGKEYNLTRHGFARDHEFTVKHLGSDTVTFLLSENGDTRMVYPFDFELGLTYTIRDSTLHFGYTVANKSNERMPFSLGAHPAFALPGDFNGYSLIFEKDEVPVSVQLEKDLLSDTTRELVLVNKILSLHYNLFDNDALIFKSLESNFITIANNGKPFLRVSFTDFPHLGLWTKKGAAFLCIEPWQGYSDSNKSDRNIMEKEGVIILPPKETYKSGFQIGIFH